MAVVHRAGLGRETTLNVIEGAAEPGAVDDGHLAAATEWMRNWEVEYQVLVASGRPGSEQAAQWLRRHGYRPSRVFSIQVRAAGATDERDAVGVEARRMPAREDEGLATWKPQGSACRTSPGSSSSPFRACRTGAAT